jgi:hypothetical protein
MAADSMAATAAVFAPCAIFLSVQASCAAEPWTSTELRSGFKSHARPALAPA